MGSTEKGKIRKISMLALGLLIDIKERVGSLVHFRGGRAKLKFEQPSEETLGFEGILPDNENSPYTGETSAGQLSSNTEVSEEADSQASYTANPEKVVAGDFIDEGKEPRREQLDPSTEQDIPLRPSEVEIPEEIQHDQEDNSEIITPGKGESEVVIPEEEIEVENPDKKEIDPERLSGNRKIKGRNKEW